MKKKEQEEEQNLIAPVAYLSTSCTSYKLQIMGKQRLIVYFCGIFLQTEQYI